MVGENRDCSEGEIKGVRMLLARAPANRTWRHRGWLVILRARAAESKNFSGNEHDDDEDWRSVVSHEIDSGTQGEACNRSGAEGLQVDTVGWGLSGAVAMLIELQPECVFRLIVGFL